MNGIMRLKLIQRTVSPAGGVSLIEIIMSIFIFALLFGQVFSAYAPAATAIASWYINMVESIIDRTGGFASRDSGLKTGDLGVEKYITPIILLGMGEELEIMHNLLVLATVLNPTVNGKISQELFEIKVEVRWGNNFSDNRPHRFKTSRWKIKPNR